VRLHPRPGVPLEFQVTKQVPDTPEGHAELERITEAMGTGEPVDFGEVSIETRLGGRVVQLLPETGVLKSGRATRKVQAILTVSSPEAGVDERLVLSCVATRTAEGLRMLARVSNRGLVQADITLHAATRRATFTFRLAGKGELRLTDQILLHRVFTAIATGGQIEMYLVEDNITSRTEFGPQPEFADGAAALPGLELLAEVGRMLGIEPEPLDTFGDHDVALLGWARQLLAAGQAPMIVAGDSLTLRGTEDSRREHGRDGDHDRQRVR
jgi:hypothetical protein